MKYFLVVILDSLFHYEHAKKVYASKLKPLIDDCIPNYQLFLKKNGVSEDKSRLKKYFNDLFLYSSSFTPDYEIPFYVFLSSSKYGEILHHNLYIKNEQNLSKIENLDKYVSALGIFLHNYVDEKTHNSENGFISSFSKYSDKLIEKTTTLPNKIGDFETHHYMIEHAITYDLIKEDSSRISALKELNTQANKNNFMKDIPIFFNPKFFIPNPVRSIVLNYSKKRFNDYISQLKERDPDSFIDYVHNDINKLRSIANLRILLYNPFSKTKYVKKQGKKNIENLLSELSIQAKNDSNALLNNSIEKTKPLIEPIFVDCCLNKEKTLDEIIENSKKQELVLDILEKEYEFERAY